MKGVAVSYAVACFRALLCVRYFAPASVPSVLFGISELSAVVLTVRALWIGKIDNSNSGILVPLLYCVPLMLRQDESPTVFAWPFACAAFIQLKLRALMLGRLTIGVPVFVKLLDYGPWSYLRHPLCLVEFALASLFILTFPTQWNCLAALVVLPGIIASVPLEERFLFTVPEYQEYARRVRWRLLPGVY